MKLHLNALKRYWAAFRRPGNSDGQTAQANENLQHALDAITSAVTSAVTEETSDAALSLSHADQLIELNNHRIKNSLQMVSSIINLSKRDVTDPSMQTMLDAIQYRILALSECHNQLSKNDLRDVIKMQDVLEGVTKSVSGAFGATDGSLDIQLSLSDITIPTRQVIPLGLLAAEMLICGHYLHPVETRRTGFWTLSTSKIDSDMVELLVSSKQAPGPETITELPKQSTEILGALNQQLEADHKTEIDQDGFTFISRFRLM